ncbi:MAG: hypothetical protein ABI556_13005 [Gemmatimonadales bacterium]
MTRARWAIAVAAAIVPVACGDETTARLTPDQEQRYAAEGVTRRAADLTFRFTRDPGGRGERWENRRASIVVTRSSLLIHKNEKVGLEVTPRTQREVSVQRSAGRIRIRSGTGRSEEVWSFEPPSDAEGWTTDIRAQIKQSKGGSTR